MISSMSLKGGRMEKKQLSKLELVDRTADLIIRVVIIVVVVLVLLLFNQMYDRFEILIILLIFILSIIWTGARNFVKGVKAK